MALAWAFTEIDEKSKNLIKGGIFKAKENRRVVLKEYEGSAIF